MRDLIMSDLKNIEAELRDVEKAIRAGYQLKFNENRRKFLQMQLEELKKDGSYLLAKCYRWTE